VERTADLRFRRLVVAGVLGLAAFFLTLPAAGPLPLLTLLLGTLSALGVGLLIVRLDPTLSEEAAPWARLLVAAALGGGLLAQLFFLLLMAHAWPRWTGPLLLGLPGLALLWPVTLPALRAALRAPKAGGRRMMFVLVLGAGWALLLLMCAAAPPIDYDSLVYHLGLPQQWLLSGGAEVIPFHHYSAFPLATEAAFTAALALGGAVAAKVLAWSFLLLACGAVALLARRLAPAGAGGTPAVAAVVFATVPAVALTSTLTYNDLWTAALLLLVFEALLRRAATGHTAPALEAGAFAGLALASKYVSLVAMPALAGAALLLVALGRRWERSVYRDAGWAALVAVVVAAPVYLRNLVVLGNPVYPAAHRLFGGGTWDEWSKRAVSDSYHGARTLDGLLDLPFDVFLKLGHFGAGADPGPLLVLAVPAAALALLLREEARHARWAAGLAFVLLVLAWWSSAMNGRYLLAAIGVLCALGASALRDRDRGWLMWPVAILLGFGTLWSADRALAFQRRVMLEPAAPYLTGREPADEYQARRRPILALYGRAREVLPPEAVVLLAGEARSFGLERRAVVATAYDPSPLALLDGEEGGALEAMRRMEVTHVLVSLVEGDRLQSQYKHFRDLGGGWKRRLQEMGLGAPVLSDDRHGIYLYEIPPAPGDG
jgi:hypothetical protein